MVFKLGKGTGGDLLLFSSDERGRAALCPRARCTYEKESGSCVAIYSNVFHRVDLAHTPWEAMVQKVVLFVRDAP